jgi:hypothetical protein
VVPFPGGPTNLSNLVLVCKRHHKQIHARVISVVKEPDSGRWVVVRPDGTRLLERPPPRLVA